MKKLFTINPLTIAIVAVAILIALGFLLSDSGGEMITDLRLVFIAMPIAFILIRGFDDFVGVTRKIGEWHPSWWLLSIPFLSVVALNLTGVSFSKLEIDVGKIPLTLFDNLMVGSIEEIWLRGILFYFLYKMWGSTRVGVIGACLAQALVFGLIHFINLGSESFAIVSFQVFYATAIGFGFGALMLVTRSIWPSIIIHSCIDLVSAIEETFNPQYVPNTEFTTNQILFVTALLLVTYVVPATIYLSRVLPRKNEIEPPAPT